MSPVPSDRTAVTLSLSSAEQWTLHHVLLDRIDLESTSGEPSRTDPPPLEVFRAFERLDVGRTTFTRSQLAAIEPILARYHHAPEWEADRAQLEGLLHQITDQTSGRHAPLSTD